METHSGLNPRCRNAELMFCRAVLQDWAREARNIRDARAKSVASRASALLWRCRASCTLAMIFAAWQARMRHNRFAVNALAVSSLARERFFRRSAFGSWAWLVKSKDFNGDVRSVFVCGSPTVEAPMRLARERMLRESALHAWARLLRRETSERLNDETSPFVWGAPAPAAAEPPERETRPWRIWAGAAQPLILQSLFPNTMRRRCESRAAAPAASSINDGADMGATSRVGLKQRLFSNFGSEVRTSPDGSRLESIASKLASSDLFQPTPSVFGSADAAAEDIRQSEVFGRDDAGCLGLAGLASFTVLDKDDGLREPSTFDFLTSSGTTSFRDLSSCER